MRFLLFTTFLYLAFLSGCGGGGSAAVSEIPSPLSSPATCGNGEIASATRPCRGRLTLPGIDNIPLSRISRTNAHMRRLWAATDYFSPVNGSREHGRLVRQTSCWSYIVECDDPEDRDSRPFTYFQNYSTAGDYEEIDYADAGLAPGSRTANAWFKRNIDNAAIRLVSLSIHPDGRGLVGQYGDALDFLVVQSAGNEASSEFPVRSGDPLFGGIKRAVDADKVVYVAGYDVNDNGDVVRHRRSSGCDTVSGACVWVPFLTPGIGPGTSFGTARVTAALASVLAVFPNTTPQNLGRLLKMSARSVPNLPNGLGVVDFTRLTTLDRNGEWRLVTSGGEFNSAVAPLQLNHVTLPGNAALASDFAISPDGGAVVFETVVKGAFARTTPNVLPGSRQQGGTPVVAGLGKGLTFRLSQPGAGLYAGGVYEYQPGNLFLSAGFGVRHDFFGLDDRYGYEPTLAYEANAGHRDLLFRISRQMTRGSKNGLVEWAQGTAVGFTARRSVALSEALRVEAALDLDKFAGGEAATVFGSLRMAESGWNRTLSVRLTHRPGPFATLTAAAELFVPADGADAFAAGVTLDVHFPHGTTQWFPGVVCRVAACGRRLRMAYDGRFWVHPSP